MQGIWHVITIPAFVRAFADCRLRLIKKFSTDNQRVPTFDQLIGSVNWRHLTIIAVFDGLIFDFTNVHAIGKDTTYHVF